MRKKIHPKYGIITIVRTDGTSFDTKSCLSVKNNKYNLEINPEDHPAWSKQTRFSGASIGKMKKFEKKYPGFDL